MSDISHGRSATFELRTKASMSDHEIGFTPNPFEPRRRESRLNACQTYKSGIGKRGSASSASHSARFCALLVRLRMPSSSSR